MATPEMVFEFAAGYPEDCECAICFCPWNFPVEVVPCGHIYCKRCVATCTQCPSCRETVTKLVEPNRVLRNIVNGLHGQCAACGWKGQRGAFLDSHTPALCSRLAREAATAAASPQQHTQQPLTLSSPQPSQSRFTIDAYFTNDHSIQPEVPRQDSTGSGGDSAARFADFFGAAATIAPAAPPPPPAPPLDPSAAASGSRSAQGSSPQFGRDVSLAVVVVRTMAEAAPPLRYHTVSAPLDSCSLDAVMAELCPDVIDAQQNIHAVAVSGDRVLGSLTESFASQNISHGSTMYILANTVHHDGNMIELFRIRSTLDNLLRDLRVVEASNRRHSQQEHRIVAETLVQLSIRLDALEGLAPEARLQRWQTCVDAGEAEEVLDRLKPPSMRQTPVLAARASGDAAHGTAAPHASPPASSAEDQPWLMYNVSQRFYDMLFAAFATFDAAGAGSLNREEARRALRWMNLPHSEADMHALFSLIPEVNGARATRITLHHACIWVQSNQRRPLHDYGMTFQRYFDALDCFHSLDQDLSGGLKPSEAVNFLCIFAARSRADAVDVVESLVSRAHTTQGHPCPSSMTSTQRMTWAETVGHELSLDDLLRVLCVEEQGWDVCAGASEAPPAAAAPAAARASKSVVAAPPPPPSRAPAPAAPPAANAAPAGRFRAFTTTNTPATASSTTAGTHHDLRRPRSFTGVNRQSEPRGQKKECIVA